MVSNGRRMSICFVCLKNYSAQKAYVVGKLLKKEGEKGKGKSIYTREKYEQGIQ